MKNRILYLLSMMPFIAMVCANGALELWHGVIAGALIHMWAWTLFYPVEINKNFLVPEHGSRPGSNTLRSRASHIQGAPDDEIFASYSEDAFSTYQYVWHESDLGFQSSTNDLMDSIATVNPATGLPMVNDTWDSAGNVFGSGHIE